MLFLRTFALILRFLYLIQTLLVLKYPNKGTCSKLFPRLFNLKQYNTYQKYLASSVKCRSSSLIIRDCVSVSLKIAFNSCYIYILAFSNLIFYTGLVTRFALDGAVYCIVKSAFISITVTLIS